MLILFRDSQRVLVANFQKPGEVLLKLRDAIRRKLPGQLARGVLLHYENARPHTARATHERIQELQWELIELLPYSPEFAPSDFRLFGPLKTHLVVRRFADKEEVKTEVGKWLRQQSSLLCCGFRRTDKEMGQVYQCWWRICREITVFPRFEYHISYRLYPSFLIY
jgi:hypothetical protein